MYGKMNKKDSSQGIWTVCMAPRAWALQLALVFQVFKHGEHLWYFCPPLAMPLGKFYT